MSMTNMYIPYMGILGGVGEPYKYVKAIGEEKFGE